MGEKMVAGQFFNFWVLSVFICVHLWFHIF